LPADNTTTLPAKGFARSTSLSIAERREKLRLTQALAIELTRRLLRAPPDQHALRLVLGRRAVSDEHDPDIPFGSASAESSPAFANISDGVPSESLSHTTLSGRSPRVPSNQRTHARPFASAPAMSGSFA